MLIVVSGMSGSGKSVALKTLEDLGFYCVDNLPADLLPAFVRSVTGEDGTPQKLAVGIDVRNRHNDLSSIPEWLSAVGAMGLDPRLVFFDTEDMVLLRRYADTRRRHPLSHLGLVLADAISLERQVLKPLRQIADTVIDTTALNVHQLRRQVITEFALGSDDSLSLLFESFAYRRGVPPVADFVFDARVLPNPHWNPELRPLSGRDQIVREYLAEGVRCGGLRDAWNSNRMSSPTSTT
nr:FIG000506: Predicted P-loop-containing kinase [uncultured bacterium]